ncbi:MAG: carbohydrate kinase [Thermoflavifilum sp.]|nr:carbohydrate kinase [Thermoflavifilum sp.]
MTSFAALFEKFRHLKALVIGDVMLDVYWWGGVERISPEAPVPIVALQRKEVRPGGAANVGMNLQALGAEVFMASVVGKDAEGEQLIEVLQQRGIRMEGVVRSSERCTTTKTRIISRSQQMLRLDHEQVHDLSLQEREALLNQITQVLYQIRPDVVVFEDYDKGVLSAELIRVVVNACQQLQIPTCVDPKKKNFWSYTGVTLFKPNLKEVREGLHLDEVNIHEGSLQHIHALLHARLRHEVSLITLSEKGVFSTDGSQYWLIPSHLRNIADVSGAGDTVIATAALVWAATRNLRLMTEIANIAGGLVCEEIGVVAIDPHKLQAECERLLDKSEFFYPQ